MSSVFSFPDRTLTSTLSGGNWTPAAFGFDTRPNLLNPLLSKKARSINALAASTLVQIDLGATARTIRVLSILSHNLSYGATVRFRGFTGSDYSTGQQLDTGAVYAYPQAFNTDDAANCPNNLIVYLANPSNLTPRYWKIEIVDTVNVNGYIELGRLWLGEALDPISIIEYGSSMVYESRDIKTESLGGVVWGSKKTSRRVFTGNLTNVKEAAKQKIFLMQKVLGTVGELVFIPDTAATAANMILEAFPATFKEVSPLVYPYFAANDFPISLQELL